MGKMIIARVLYMLVIMVVIMLPGIRDFRIMAGNCGWRA